jgi:hypothetical protein
MPREHNTEIYQGLLKMLPAEIDRLTKLGVI